MLPRALHVGPVTLYYFGIFVFLGFLAGLWLGARLCRERGVPGEALLDAGTPILAAGIAGARLLFVALNWAEFAARPWEIPAFWHGGMSFHGGALAGALAGALWIRRRRLPALAIADAAAPALALGYAVGRIGCLLNGCCYGASTSLPWGMRFEGPSHPPHHPAQVYAAAAGLLLTGLLVWSYRRPHRAGQVMALFAGGYSVYRFAIEGLRSGVTAQVAALGLTQAQLFSLLCLAAAVTWWLWLRRHGAPAPELSPSGGAALGPAPGRGAREFGR